MSDNHIIIDQRPLGLVMLFRTYRVIMLTVIAIVFYHFLSKEPWEGLSVPGYRVIGTFIVCLILWCTQLLPLAITGLLAIVLIPLLGIMSTKEAFSFFGSEAVFFILGAFILGAALLKTGLSTRIAVLFLKGGSDSPKKLIWRIMLSCALLSCIMPEHAVAAFFLPIILEMARSLEYVPFGGSYGRSLFMAMAWGCIIGGVVTFLGGARAPLALGIMYEMTGQSITFGDWMKFTLPLSVPLLFAGFWMILRFYPVDVESVESILKILEKRRKRLGMIKWGERWVAVILSGAIFSWIFFGHKVGLANVAIASVVVLFFFNVVQWQDVEEHVNWGIILMYGGAICLGRAMNDTEAIHWLASKVIYYPDEIAVFLSSILGVTISGPYIFVLLVSLAALVVSEFIISNAAVVAILLPVAIGTGQTLGLSPVLMALIVAVPSGLASLFPISTTPMAIAYSSGYLKISDLLISGIVMNLTAWLIFITVIYFLAPVYGIAVW